MRGRGRDTSLPLRCRYRRRSLTTGTSATLHSPSAWPPQPRPKSSCSQLLPVLKPLGTTAAAQLRSARIAVDRFSRPGCCAQSSDRRSATAASQMDRPLVCRLSAAMERRKAELCSARMWHCRPLSIFPYSVNAVLIDTAPARVHVHDTRGGVTTPSPPPLAHLRAALEQHAPSAASQPSPWQLQASTPRPCRDAM